MKALEDLGPDLLCFHDMDHAAQHMQLLLCQLERL